MEAHRRKWCCAHVSSSTGSGEPEAALTCQALGEFRGGGERPRLGEKEEVERATFRTVHRAHGCLKYPQNGFSFLP